MKKLILFVILLIPVLVFLHVSASHTDAALQEDIPWDIVPDEATARKIAETLWLPVYGKMVLSEKPYVVALRDSAVWVVHGTLPKGYRGGTAYIEIRKKDCRVLNMYHGK